ncbi:MAG: hypothetical protein ACE14S_05695 [Candidatus Bathyarchaeia archaeon]
MIALVSLLLASMCAGPAFVGLSKANPYYYDSVEDGVIAPPEGTQPPDIFIVTPVNGTAYASGNISITFTATMPPSNNVSLDITKIYYTGSWQRSPTQLDFGTLPLALSINLTDVPEGPRWLKISAEATGMHMTYLARGSAPGASSIPAIITHYVTMKIVGSSTVNFTVDTTPPIVSVLSSENKTYCEDSGFPLNFSATEQTSWVGYSLDGQSNVTISGNTTLNELALGSHALVLYANDTAGNEASTASAFTIVPSPTPSPTPSSETSPSPSPIPSLFPPSTSSPSQNAEHPPVLDLPVETILAVTLATIFLLVSIALVLRSKRMKH